VIATRLVHLLFLLLLVPAVLQVGSPTQTYTTFTSLIVYSQTQSSAVSIGATTFSGLTSSTYGTSVGTIPASYVSPATGQQICFYAPYHFHVDDSVREVIGTVSGSSPFNFYLMSQTQYDGFVAGNPPCGSSYVAIKLGYLERTFSVDFTPSAGDYYIVLENIASSPMTYTVELSAIVAASSAIYSTTEQINLVTYTSTLSQLALPVSQSETSTQTSPTPATPFTAAIVVLVFVASLAAFIWSKRRRRKEERTRVY